MMIMHRTSETVSKLSQLNVFLVTVAVVMVSLRSNRNPKIGEINSVINIHRQYYIKLSILHLRMNMTSLETYQEASASEEKDLGIMPWANKFLKLVVTLDLK